MYSNEVQCGLLTKENLKQMDNVLEELQIDLLRLKDFLEHPQNLAFIVRCNDEVAGFIYGYSLMSLSSNPQLSIYSVEVLSKFQNISMS